MADVISLNNPKKSVIPSLIAAATADPAQAASPDYQIPPEVADAVSNVAPSATVPTADNGATADMKAATPDAPVPDMPPPVVSDALSSLAKPDTGAPSLASPPHDTNVPLLTPQVKKAPGFFDKVKKYLPAALNIAGVVGGGLEAAGSPGHQAPGADLFEHETEAEANRALEGRKLDIEQQQANTNEGYRQALAQQYGLVPVDMPDGSTAYVQQKDKGGFLKQYVTNAGKNDVASINANSRAQVAALQAGAAMTITPQMAQIAGQPNLAGQQLSGHSLANFMKMFNGAGAAIHDLGDEGLWAVDKMGNRIQRVAVSSPSVARASEYAKERAANTPTNVLRLDDNGNPYMAAISQAEQLKTGEPTAQAENTVLGPTGDMRNKAAIAERAKNTGLRVLQDLQDPNIANKIGPLIGRFGNLENVIGNAPPELAETMQDLKSFAQFVGGQHPVRGLNALEAFEKAIGGIGQDPKTLAAKIASQLKTSDFVSNQGTIKPNRVNAARKPAAQGGGPANNMISVQIPGHPPGKIPASQKDQFLKDNPGAQVIGGQ